MESTRIPVHSDQPPGETWTTTSPESPPLVIPREREVLVALCRPMLSGDVFNEPASIPDVARELVSTEAAVKQHLVRPYDKFGIHDPTERRRVRLPTSPRAAAS